MSLAIDATSRDIRNAVVKMGQGAFFAHHAAAVNVVTGATATQLTVDTEIVDMCGWFASNTFTPKQPGLYLLFASAYVTADVDLGIGQIAQMFIRKNGATPAYVTKAFSLLFTGAPSYFAPGMLNQVVILDANGVTDSFDVASVHDAAGTISVSDISFGGVFVSYNNP